MAKASLRAAALLREELKKIDGLPVLTDELIGKGGVAAMDPGKVTIMTSALGLTGPEAAEILRREKLPLSLSMKITCSFLLPMLMTMQNLPKRPFLSGKRWKKPETGTERSASGCSLKDSGTATPAAGRVFCAP